jgi:hypothetical protein
MYRIKFIKIMCVQASFFSSKKVWKAGVKIDVRSTQKYIRKGTGNAVPVQACAGPEGSRRLRLPDFKTIGTTGWKGCQPYAPAAFTPRKYPWYSFLLEAKSTPRPQGGKFQ